MGVTVMHDGNDHRKSLYCLVSLILSGIVTAGGILVVLGWLFDWPTVKGVLPGLATMKFNTALGFILCGVSLFLRRHPGDPSHQPETLWGMICGVMVALLGAATLSEYIWGWRLGIDELVVRDLGHDTGMIAPGRMAPVTAVCFVLFGSTLAALDWKPFGWFRPAECFVVLATCLALMAVEGYILGVSALYHFFLVAHIALNTSILFVALGIGILCARTSDGLMAVLTARHLGGYLIRKVLPLILILPTVLAWALLHGHRAFDYAVEVDLAIFAAISMLLFALVMVLSGMKLNQLHAQVEERNESNARFATIVESSPSAVIGCACDGTIQAWNHGAENVLGLTASEAIGRSLRSMIPHDQLDREDAVIDQLLRGDIVPIYESTRRRHDDRVIDVSVSTATLRTPSGEITGFSQVARDITQQLKDRVALQEARDQLKIIVDNLNDGLVIAGMDGVLIHCNPAALNMHDLDRFDNWKRPLPEFGKIFRVRALDGTALSPDQWPLARVMRGEAINDVEVILHHMEQGWEKRFSYSGKIVRDSNDRSMAFVSIRDVTGKRDTQKREPSQVTKPQEMTH